jgi:hypothetical protein
MFRPWPPSRQLGRFQTVLPSGTVTRIVIGGLFYGYYGFICRPSAHNGHISAPFRRRCRSYNAPAQTALHRVRSHTFFAHPPPLPNRVTERISDFDSWGCLVHPTKPSRGSHQVWVANLAPASFRSFIGLHRPLIPSSGSLCKFLRAPLPSPTCYLLSGFMTGLSPVSL